MFKALLARVQQGHRTIGFPQTAPVLPDRLRGRPVLDPARCPEGCRECVEVCPTTAITIDSAGVQLDLGRCLFCPECERACPHGAIRFTQEYRLATRQRPHLILDQPPRRSEPPEALAMREVDSAPYRLAQALDQKARRLFGRSLKLRQVSAGGCNGCEADVNVLNTVVFDLGRFGVQFVASPRHADGLLITGPVPRNMHLALRKTYEAVPPPKLVIAVGACAISGGPFLDHAEVHNGADGIVPVDLYIPGCPPHPITILDGLLRYLGRIQEDQPLAGS